MTRRTGPTPGARLLMVGNIPMDLTVQVARLPTAGEDARGISAAVEPGGGIYVLRAAWRDGLLGRFAGSHGTGSFGDQVREALADLDCEVLTPPLADRDTGWVVAMVDGSGERTFVSSPGAVVPLDIGTLTPLRPDPSDLVYVSGYSLGMGDLSLPLAKWTAGLPADNRVFCDLGPWGADATTEILGPVLDRVDWVACNGREATRLTGEADPAAACAALQRRTRQAVALVRVSALGCWVATPEGEPELISAPHVREVLDTTGAGDTHSGTFLAAVARGEPVAEAVTLANAAAARAVTRSDAALWGSGG